MSPARDIPLRHLRLRRSDDTFADRLHALRHRWRTLLRLSLGTALAFGFATHILGHRQAFFAPIATIIVLIAGAGLRGRTLFELVLGVSTGVLMGELIIQGIGAARGGHTGRRWRQPGSDPIPRRDSGWSRRARDDPADPTQHRA
jgi:hypothetical protein